MSPLSSATKSENEDTYRDLVETGTWTPLHRSGIGSYRIRIMYLCRLSVIRRSNQVGISSGSVFGMRSLLVRRLECTRHGLFGVNNLKDLQGRLANKAAGSKISPLGWFCS